MRRGLQWVVRRRLAFGRGPAGWIAGILLALLTLTSLIAVFIGWRMAKAPISLDFAIPQIEQALAPADGTLAVELGGFQLRRDGLAFVLEAENMAVYRVDPVKGRETAALATLPTAQIHMSVPALIQDGILAPNRVTTQGLRVTAERGPDGIEMTVVDGGEAGADSMRLSAFRRLLNRDARLRYLKSVEMTDLTFRVLDPLLGISWETQGTDMRFVNGDNGLIWDGQARLETHLPGPDTSVEDGGLIRWHLTLPPEAEAPTGGSIGPADVSARLVVELEELEPAPIIELVPGLRDIVRWHGAVSGTLQTAFQTNSLPDSIEYALQVGEGRLLLPGSDRYLGFQSARLAGGLRLDGQTLEVDELTLLYPGGIARLRGNGVLRDDETVQVQLSGSGLNLAWLSTLVPGSERLSAVDVSLATDITASLRPDGGIDRAAVSVRSDPGRVALSGILPAPVSVARSALDLRIADGGRRIELQRLDLRLPRAAGKPDLPISITGSAIKGGEAQLQVVAGELDVSDMKRLWPFDVGEGARVWIVDQVSEGLVPEMTADIAFRLPDGPDFSEPENVRVEARMPLRDVTLTYWPPMPEATGIDADARITEKLFEATILRGTSAGMQITGGNLEFTGLDKGKGHEHTAMSFDMTGPARNLMAVLDRPPLGFARYLDLPPEEIDGTISGTLKAAFPPIQELELEQIDIEAVGATRDLTLPNAAFDQDLQQGRIAFNVDKSALKLDGDAVLAGAEVALQGDLRFVDSAPFRSRFQLQGTLDDAARQQLGFSEFPFSPDVVSGPVKLEMTATEPRNGSTVIDVAADLSDATVALDLLDWQSPPGDYAAVSAQVRIANGRLRRVDAFRVTAPQLSMAGDVEWPEAGEASPTVRIGELRHGAGTNVTVLGAPAPEGGYRVSVAGQRLDVRPLLNGLTQSGNGDSPSAGEDRLFMDLTVEAMQVGSGPPLSNVRGIGLLVGDDLRTASLAATSEGGGQVSMEVQADGTAALNASDAGALLAALGISERVEEGNLQVNARLPRDGGAIAGTVLMWSGVFREAPFMVRLFSGGTINRPELVRSWSIDRFDTSFSLDRGILNLEDGRLSGGELGATFQGWVDLNRNMLDISGAIVPVYSVNRVLRAIPLIGDVLTGGEGLFAANYRATGNAEEPEFNVNPLTAFAPGLLRRLFGGTASDPPQGQ